MKTTAQINGFTLVELLLVVSIIAVLSSFMIPGFSNYVDNQNMIQATEILKSDLRTAQNKALSSVGAYSEGITYWGIKIPANNSSTYNFFKATANDANACNNAVTESTSDNLPGTVVVKNAANACVFFSIEDGDANFINFAGSTITLGYPTTAACYGVEVNSVGMIRSVDLCP